MFLPCRPCCGTPPDCPAESITVSLVDLPNENRVAGAGGGAVYDADNYMTSNEGEFTLVKTADFPSGKTHVCFYDYSDAGGGYTFLSINVILTHYYAATTPYWQVRVTVVADGGRLSWQKNTTAAVLPTTFTNTDVTVNNSAEYGYAPYPYVVPLPWNLQPTMTATIQAVTPGSLPQCQPTCTQMFPATPGTCNQIMSVAAATDRPGYCGESPTIFSVAPVGTPDRTVTFVNAGTDTLNLTLPDWTGSRGSGTAVTVAFGGATHSLGWGGRDCLALLVGYEAGTSTLCTSGGTGPGGFAFHRRSGWITAFNVVATFDSSGSGGSVTDYNCVAVVSARLSRVYPSWPSGSLSEISNIAPTRRIVFEIALYRYHGFEPTGNSLTQLNDTHYAFTSDGTLSEDAYTYGSFPTFTQANAATTAKLCFISIYGSLTWSSQDFTLEQG